MEPLSKRNQSMADESETISIHYHELELEPKIATQLEFETIHNCICRPPKVSLQSI